MHEYFGARLPTGIGVGTPVQARLAKPLTTRSRTYDVDGQRLGLRSMRRQPDRSTDSVSIALKHAAPEGISPPLRAHGVAGALISAVDPLSR
jgi:hypothetical protein